MPIGFCSVCKIEKDDSKWQNISEQGKEKAELVDAPYKIRKPIEMEVEANTSLQNQIIELKAELEKITSPSNQHIK
ncbi:10356_t:CDS:2, partial [Entrophospora sp. SA101]